MPDFIFHKIDGAKFFIYIINSLSLLLIMLKFLKVEFSLTKDFVKAVESQSLL